MGWSRPPSSRPITSRPCRSLLPIRRGSWRRRLGSKLMTDENRTLEQLDGYDSGDPEGAATPMVARCIRLQKPPLNALNDADLRLLIGQGIGLRHLVIKALERL